MHKDVFLEFEKVLRKNRKAVKGRVLEIGAVPTSDSLLNIDVFRNADELIGVNLDGGKSYDLGDEVRNNDYKIIQGNANQMDFFDDDSFDVIVSNAVFEHDKFFWKSIAEIVRIAKKDALVVIGTPGYDVMENIKLSNEKDFFRRNVILDNRRLLRGVPTVAVHDWPGDYYRFSPQTYKDVFFESMRDVEIYSYMIPPRIIGAGFVSK